MTYDQSDLRRHVSTQEIAKPRRWQWDTLHDDVVWEPTGVFGSTEDEQESAAFIFFPEELDRSQKIKVNVLACGDEYHVLHMTDCAGKERWVVKDSAEAFTFDSESSAMVRYEQLESAATLTGS